MSGLFVVIEGQDGAGKSVVAKRLADLIRSNWGREVCTIAFPGHTPPGLIIRQILRGEATPPDPKTRALALLFESDRAWTGPEILGRVAAGEIVIADRYDMSTVVYQYLMNGLEVQLAPGRVQPEITILLSVDPDEARKRRVARGGKPELFESEEVQLKVANHYEEAPRYLPDRIAKVGAGVMLGEVVDVALGVIASVLVEKEKAV